MGLPCPRLGKITNDRIHQPDEQQVKYKIDHRVAHRMRAAVDIDKSVNGVSRRQNQDDPANG